MNFSPQGESYRLGDFARSTMPDGDYVGIITTFEGALGKENQPQIKVVASLVGNQQGKKHTWWYTCTKQACFRLFDDLIRLGVDPNFDAGPPIDGTGQNRWAAMFAAGLLNKAVNISISTRKGDRDFTDTTLTGFATIGPDGQPVQAAGSGPFPGAPSSAPDPVPTTPAANPFASPPTGTVDVGSAADMFKRS